MGKPWFRVKRFGYGAGLPCSWEGWAVFVGYLAFCGTITELGAPYRDGHPIAYFVALMVPTFALISIARLKSDGPWKWRNGGK